LITALFLLGVVSLVVDLNTGDTTGPPYSRLVRQAIDRFSAWKFEAGEELLARALEERRKHESEPPRSPYFNTCVLAILT
jgi:hypothetical protein